MKCLNCDGSYIERVLAWSRDWGCELCGHSLTSDAYAEIARLRAIVVPLLPSR